MYIDNNIVGNIVVLNTKCDEEFIVYINNVSKEVLIGIQINDMRIDGVGIYNSFNLTEVIEEFESKPVYDYMIKNSDLQSKNIITEELLNLQLLDALKYCMQNKIFIGIESIFNEDQVMDVGYIIEVNNNGLFLNCINLNGKIEDNPYFIKIENIIKIEIDSAYLKAYEKFFNQLD